MGGGTGTYGSLNWDYTNFSRRITMILRSENVPWCISGILRIVTIDKPLLDYYQN